MKPSMRTLGEILYAPSQYVIPVFQRNYRWERSQWTKLWDSLNEIQRPEKTGNHFMGFLVFVPGDAFAVDTNEAANGVRIALGAMDDRESLRNALRLAADALDQSPAVLSTFL